MGCKLLIKTIRGRAILAHSARLATQPAPPFLRAIKQITFARQVQFLLPLDRPAWPCGAFHHPPPKSGGIRPPGLLLKGQQNGC